MLVPQAADVAATLPPIAEPSVLDPSPPPLRPRHPIPPPPPHLPPAPPLPLHPSSPPAPGGAPRAGRARCAPRRPDPAACAGVELRHGGAGHVRPDLRRLGRPFGFGHRAAARRAAPERPAHRRRLRPGPDRG